MHQALYRKWRPQTFNEVCGQEHITDILRYEVENNKLSHAYLFCGSRGTGKTTCAKILAKAANCESPVNGSPCCECESCRSIAEGTTTDIIEMDAASNNSVGDIRNILDEVVYTPSSLKYKVYIVDEVHMLSSAAFNALLKTLEEPPEHVIFILATTEMQKLPATIISRCQRFDFHRIPANTLTSRLHHIAKEEQIELDDDAALIIARLAQGGMRDAISLFELCAAGGNSVTGMTVSDAVGFSGRGPMSGCVRAITAHNCDALFKLIADTDASARDIAVFWQELVGYYRDMLVMKTAGKESAVKYLDLTDSEAEMIYNDANAFSKETLSFHSKLLDEAYAAMQRPGANRRTVAELALVRLSDEKLSTSTDALLARIEALEQKLTLVASGSPIQISTATAPTPAPKAEPVPKAAEPAKAPAVEQTDTTVSSCNETQDAPTGEGAKRIRRWAEVTDSLRKTNPGAASLLNNSAAGYTEGDKVVIVCKNDITKRLASAPETIGNLASVLSLVLETPIRSDNVLFKLGTEEELKPETDTLASVLGNIAK